MVLLKIRFMGKINLFLLHVAPESTDIPPTLSPMKNVTVQEGNPATFKTQVTGKPKPTIQWFREDALIPQSPDFQVIYFLSFFFNIFFK